MRFEVVELVLVWLHGEACQSLLLLLEVIERLLSLPDELLEVVEK